MVDRIFKAKDCHGAEMEFELVMPSLAVENEGERQYRVAYSAAIREGVFPRQKLKEVMKGHEMWTKEDDVAYKTSIAQIAISQKVLEEARLKGDDEECLKVAKEIQKYRARMWELFMIQNSVFTNSAEGYAELIKAESVMAFSVRIKATNDRYWKSYKDFVLERDENLKSTVYKKVVDVQNLLLNQLSADLESQYPENDFLKDAKTRMFERDLEESVEIEVEKRAAKALEENGSGLETEADKAEADDQKGD